MVKRLCGLAAALVLVTGSPATAQIPIEIEPYVGVYVPFQDLVKEAVDGVDVVLGHKEGLAVGGRLGLGLGGIGVEGNFMYAFSDVEGKADGSTGEESAALWVADARLVLKLLPGPIGLHVNGGVALIGRSGDFYKGIDEGKTKVGGAVGAGLRVKLPGILAIRGDADVYLYSAKLTADIPELGGVVTTESQFQADLVLSAGLVFSL
jgi:hypothetical protein